MTIKKRFTVEQIITALKRVESGTDVKTLCLELGVHIQDYNNLHRQSLLGMKSANELTKSWTGIEGRNSSRNSNLIFEFPQF